MMVKMVACHPLLVAYGPGVEDRVGGCAHDSNWHVLVRLPPHRWTPRQAPARKIPVLNNTLSEGCPSKLESAVTFAEGTY